MTMLFGLTLYLLFVAVIWPLDADRFALAVALLIFANGAQIL